MPRQERVSKRPAHRAVERPVVQDGSDTLSEGSGSGHSPDPSTVERADRFAAELDELLDEIDDEFSEQEAESFVRAYVQRGGE